MPSSRRLIASNTLTGSAASVTFSNIPSTYTDLVLRISALDSQASVDTAFNIKINGATTSQSGTSLYGSGSAAASARQTTGPVDFNRESGASATANTFGSIELYIPSYTVSQNKPISNFGVAETNATAVQMGVNAALWSNTAAITSIEILSSYATNWAVGSSFFLYGLVNS